jgi:hypothetical protein
MVMDMLRYSINKQILIKIIVLLSIFSFMAGCATTQPERATVNIKTLPGELISRDEKSWWRVQFVKSWPEDTPAIFYYDPLIAEQIIHPILIEHHEHIELWRFHRRAVRDAAGNKFSFIFYTDAANARLIKQEISANNILQRMVDAGLIEDVWYSDYDAPENKNISHTSDAAWPVEIQNSWPYFIMGTSQGWLALIGEIAHDKPINAAQATLDELIEYYKDINEEIDDMWRKFGRHAYMHHISGIFAYRPIEISF